MFRPHFRAAGDIFGFAAGEGWTLRVIYVDILLAINLAVNYLLLFAAARLSGNAFSRLRGLLGAAAGAAYSLILLVEVPPVWLAISKFAVSAAMVFLAAGRGGFLRYLKMLVLFYGAGFVFAGAMTAFALLFRPDSFLLENGIFYYEIPPGAIVIYACAAFAATELIRRLTERNGSQGYCEAWVVFRGKSARVKGFFDSGCCLADPFTDAPVAVCRPDTLADILPPEHAKAAADPCAGIPEGCRLVPAESLAGSSMLLCFRPERVTLRRGGKRYEPEALLIGLSAGAPEDCLLFGRNIVLKEVPPDGKKGDGSGDSGGSQREAEAPHAASVGERGVLHKRTG